MAAYPSTATLPILDSSTTTVDDGLTPDRATGGGLKMRSMYASDKRNFQIKHELTTSQRDTLSTFYNTNKLLNVDFTWPGNSVTYVVRFAKAPTIVERAGNRVMVDVVLMEV
jgi:hypothetical protein